MSGEPRRTRSHESIDPLQLEELSDFRHHPTHLELGSNLLRASDLSTVLRRGGQFWRTSPCDLAPEAKKQLWQYSSPCKEIDYFISHTWATPGWQKYVFLALWSNSKYGLVAGLLVTTIILVFKFCGVYPFNPTTFMRFHRWEGQVVMSYPLVVAIVPPLVLAIIFLRPRLPRVVHHEPTVFLDVLCINQHDTDLMLQGVYGLGAFCEISKKLLLLWSPPYFSRLWCVYEIAAFTQLSTTKDIHFIPMFMFITAFFVYIILWVGICAVMYIGRSIVEKSVFFWLWYVIGYFGMSVPLFLISMDKVRSSLQQVYQLQQGLLSFNVTGAACRLDGDRRYVMSAIDKWFGGAEKFNKYVRKQMYFDVMDKQCSLNVSYTVALAITAPWGCLMIDMASGFAMSSMPPTVLFQVLLVEVALTFFALPLAMRVLFFTAAQGADKLRTNSANVALALLNSIVDALLVGMGVITMYSHIAAAVIYFLVGALLTYLAFTKEHRPPMDRSASFVEMDKE